jgi:hypothetical protein
MASGSRQKTTMAKLNRERAVRERRERKQARKDERKAAAAIEAQTPAEALAPEATEHDDAPLEDGGESPESMD